MGHGAMGRACLRTMIDHPAAELVGVYTYSEAKGGRDAGELVGRPSTGVLAPTDLARILATEADVVVHTGQFKTYTDHVDDYVAILESGKTVLSLNGYSHPMYWNDERTRRLQEACKRGGSTLMGTGMNPGVLVEQLAATASGMCSRIDHLAMTECFDASEVRNPHYLFTMLGFGADTDVDPNDEGWGPTAALNPMYEEALAALAHHLSLPLERVTTAHRVFGATEDLHLPAGTVPRGSVSHTQWRWIVGGLVMNAVPLVVAAPPGIVVRRPSTPFRYPGS